MTGHSERSEESHTQRAGNGLRCEMLRCAQHDELEIYVCYLRDMMLELVLLC